MNYLFIGDSNTLFAHSSILIRSMFETGYGFKSSYKWYQKNHDSTVKFEEQQLEAYLRPVLPKIPRKIVYLDMFGSNFLFLPKFPGCDSLRILNKTEKMKFRTIISLDNKRKGLICDTVNAINIDLNPMITDWKTDEQKVLNKVVVYLDQILSPKKRIQGEWNVLFIGDQGGVKQNLAIKMILNYMIFIGMDDNPEKPVHRRFEQISDIELDVENVFQKYTVEGIKKP